ncbi:Gldg family protein [Mediterraneibacter glycyrrhizinilyticus]|uniref:Gldg family protein n=1 Tax=Mediterraneibacter glycyrrhizinilyticus TaxID=342942 RepID=UPI0025AB19BD|nr:Gldg family protein [Mediterraneibacter glycyrrhizinilyticus]MDN0061918.1 Gldg family protein [Mediterraneibacter glycyrrhizinilyticus]
MNKIKSLKNIFRTSGTKHGAYSVGMTVLVLAVVIVFNLVVGQIPEAYRNLDVSSTKIYDISDTTTELLDDLDSEVDMKVLAVKDDTDERITTFLSRYASLSDKINAEWIDPVLHPSALTDYDTTENTIVISCEDTGKTTTVSFNDILVMDQYSYYYYGTTSYTEFDGEGQLTGAVNYVTNEADHKIYQTTGHGESTLSTTITDLMEKNSYTLSEVNLLMSTSIPEDCDLLLMYAPTTDLSEDEAQMLRDYLAGGGNAMILFGDTSSADLPNLAGVLSEYGIEAADGYIADPTRCYQGNYYYIFPELSVSGELADNISSEMVLLTNAHGMNLSDPERDTISTTSFMSSSDQAYAVTEETQQQGSYALGAVATETIESTDEEESDSGNDAETDTAEAEDTSDSAESDSEEAMESRLTVISAGSLIDQSITDTFPQLENTQIFMNAVTANFEGVQNLSIEAKSLGTEYNTIQHTGVLSLLVIFGIPAVILIGGFVVWFRRRRA